MKCSDKKLQESIEKVVGGNYLQKCVCVLILCNLRCSATQQFSLSLALAGPYRVVRITWKQGIECTVLIPFLHLISHYFRMFAAPWLQSCLLCSGIPSFCTLHPKGEGLGWAIVHTPHIRVTLAYLAACTDIKCRWSTTRVLSLCL